MSDDVPAGFWRRSKAVLSLAAGVAREEVKHQVRSKLATAEVPGASELRARIEQAKLMAESLGRLKGAFMKAGQLLSIDASDLLPPEAQAILSKLQGDAEPVDFEVLRTVLLEDLGAERMARLEGLGPNPAASASMGQVHRARVDGTDVAVKIQYPGVAASIDADIGLLEKLGASWSAVSRTDIDLSGTFDELRALLHHEADYVRERTYLERFRALVADDPRFVVPRAHAELSTSRVLTMDWAEGIPLGVHVQREPPREWRTTFGADVLDLYCREFFEWGVVQTDPNFGNFLVRPGERTIVLLDFGATLEYDAAFRAGYADLLQAVARGDSRRIVDAGVAFELVDARESAATKDLFVEMLVGSVAPFQRGRQPFAFGDAAYAARSQDVTKRFIRSLRYSPPPRRILFLHRKLGGLFQLLKRLDVTLDLTPYWERMLGGPPPEASPSA
ncbi:MAG: AarF/ABC1/UbiB kinase family protein [Polyangiaceae bacterium]